MRKKQNRLCFTLEINRRPVLVLSASSPQAALARIQEDWFAEELERMRSSGKPILRFGDTRSVRAAYPNEIGELELGRGFDEARGEDTKYAFAFLIPVDSEPN